ncbi:hypothetical protein AQUCO_06100010v1 [Aquilegia coerulea]|uniref:Uncharacterized protein n=1 Tax=Aquilegia coerulea TaxID=218851 RepID=A0A2G5CD54_AQUCA|nr:hypothetical protein AQUCO_06100010v1 [Aquilegia coerulea]
MTPDTTTLDYWLNWRFLLCLIWVLSSMLLAAYLIWRYEGSNSSKTEDVQTQQERRRSINADEAWMPCVRGIHPGWLLAFRIFGFLMLLGMLITDVVVDGFGIFFFYTQWTFALVTIYFGLGSLLSFYGCCQYFIKADGDHVALDTERGTYVAPTYEENGNTCNIDQRKYTQLQHNRQYYVRQTAGNWGYVFQVIFQMNAGAVILTDCVFWFIIYPFLSTNDHSLSVVSIKNSKQRFNFL